MEARTGARRSRSPTRRTPPTSSFRGSPPTRTAWLAWSGSTGGWIPPTSITTPSTRTPSTASRSPPTYGSRASRRSSGTSTTSAITSGWRRPAPASSRSGPIGATRTTWTCSRRGGRSLLEDRQVHQLHGIADRDRPQPDHETIEREPAVELPDDALEHRSVLFERVGIEGGHAAAGAQAVDPDDRRTGAQGPPLPLPLGQARHAADHDVGAQQRFAAHRFHRRAPRLSDAHRPWTGS